MYEIKVIHNCIILVSIVPLFALVMKKVIKCLMLLSTYHTKIARYCPSAKIA